MEQEAYIIVKGEKYPCGVTMGALLRYEEVMGVEMDGSNLQTAIEGNSLKATMTYLYCCVVGACAREGKPFDMDFMAFCDGIGPDEMARWQSLLASHQTEVTEEKKTEG